MAISKLTKDMIANHENFAYGKVVGYDLVRREFRYSEGTLTQKESYRQSKVTYKNGALAITSDTEKESILVGDFIIGKDLDDSIEYLESAGYTMTKIF